MTTIPDPILHVALADDLARAHESGRYRCASLESEGFVHCCDPGQLAGVVARYYKGVDDLVLLDIDPHALDVELVRESAVEDGERFPHVYGSIPLEAVRRTRAFGLDDPARIALAGGDTER